MRGQQLERERGATNTSPLVATNTFEETHAFVALLLEALAADA